MSFSSGINREVFQIVSIGLIVVALLILFVRLITYFRKKKGKKTEATDSEKVSGEKNAGLAGAPLDVPEQQTQMATQLAQKTKEVARLQAKCERLEKELAELKEHHQGRIVRAKTAYAALDETKRILVVEDNEKILKEAVDILRKLDYKVETAASGYIALQLVRESAPRYYDLILMDAIMEDMDGYETALKIREMNRTDMKRIPIVAMSANTFEREASLAKEAHIDGTVAKPLNAQQIERIVRRCLPFDAETFNYII